MIVQKRLSPHRHNSMRVFVPRLCLECNIISVVLFIVYAASTAYLIVRVHTDTSESLKPQSATLLARD